MNDLNNSIEKIRFSSREVIRELGLLAKEEPYGLPLSFRHILIELDLHGSLTHVELANFLRLDKSTVSRIVKKLINQKLVVIKSSADDQRYKRIIIAPAGKKALTNINNIANQQVNDALLQLSKTEQISVVSAMDLYAKALKRSRVQNEFVIRAIQKRDNLEIMMIIKKVLKEYGADRRGFAFVDPELNDMHLTFNKKKSVYLVIERKSDNTIIGGAGIGFLEGAAESICELKKMYLSSDARGLRLGYSLLQKILVLAKEKGYKKCYLETLHNMEKANNLYKKFGFTVLKKPLGNTGHFGCDAWYIKEL